MEFRTIGDYIATRAAQMRTSVRGLSLDLNWSESYLDGVGRGTFAMSLDRARALGRHFYLQLHDGRDSDPPSLEEYIAVCLAAGLPWPPPTALRIDILETAFASLDAFNMAELIQYARYLRTRPAPAELAELAVETLGAAESAEKYKAMPQAVVVLAERLAALPDELQKKTVAQLGDTVSLVEQLAGATSGKG